MVRGDDGKWRLRAIHFGTNNLDNPVLTKVKNTLMRDGIIGAIASLAGRPGARMVGRAPAWSGTRRPRQLDATERVKAGRNGCRSTR